jgi:glyoxylase-like metal-dependent hydrolase (beta-lactamase superfamily II)
MAAATTPLSFDTSFSPQTDTPVQVAPGIVRVTAPNSGPYTYTGTNSFILGDEEVAVVDPGPDDARHFEALVSAIGGRKVVAIILTHTHRDHSALAPRLKAALGAPLWFEGAHRPSRQPRQFERDGVRRESDYGLEPDRRLRDAEMLTISGIEIEVIATPGHCANHLCFGIRNTPMMLSGDHVMGWSSTMIAVPDGSMAAYLDSLRKVSALPYMHYLPAHGGPIEDGPSYARALLQHRELRNEEVVRAVRGGAKSIGDLQRAVYPKLALPLIPAARMTLAAHVEYLADRNLIKVRRGWLGPVLSS